MIDTPLVSIICSTYNHELYIAQCLEGFLMQKTNFIFEVLVHDDASTDNTAEIISEYEHRYPQIIKPIYQKENQYSKGEDIFGKYQCARAKGKYIALCEGDDYWIDPLKLQKQVDYLEQHSDYALVYTLSKIFDQDNNQIKENLFGWEYKGYDELLAYNCISTLTTCIRRDVILEYLQDVKPGEKNWLMGDYPMWLWIGYYHKIKYFPDITSVYRVLKESASHSQTLEKNEKFILSTIDITTYYINKFNLSPTNIYFQALNEYYYELYNRYIHIGNLSKAKHYAKLIYRKKAPSRIRRKLRYIYFLYIKVKLLNFLTHNN